MSHETGDWPTDAAVRLWAAVIDQAIADATATTRAKKPSKIAVKPGPGC
jgi:hypothetical protein